MIIWIWLLSNRSEYLSTKASKIQCENFVAINARNIFEYVQIFWRNDDYMQHSHLLILYSLVIAVYELAKQYNPATHNTVSMCKLGIVVTIHVYHNAIS